MWTRWTEWTGKTMTESLIPKHDGYRKLKSFQVSELVYDVTVRFCDKYIHLKSRTHDQMVQAARSGVQNIAEGSQTSGTSKKMELKLTNVARARDIKKNGPYGLDGQATSISSTRSVSPDYPEIVANGALALLMVACSLLDRQLASLPAQFEKSRAIIPAL
jgi:hypothetical protein